ncbi:MAG: glycosyltransferase [Rhodobacterales bacterium]|nr:glycosyltransferase [Rhodobacterales bacterium]
MLHHEIFRQPAKDEPLILAVFSYRYDAHLVPDLIENIRAGVHGFVAWDDRTADTELSDEPSRRSSLFNAARALGADWLLTPDPDERLESGFSGWLPDLIAEGDRTVWNFALREMYSPTHYRTDGAWGGKSKVILLPVAAARVDPAQRLHFPTVGDGAGFLLRDARINLYHLRMATSARRQLRRDLYAAADPDRRFQAIGYDYLADDRGLRLEPIPKARGFLPPFVDDHGLWSPDPQALGDVRPDPYEARFVRAAHFARRQGQMDAHHVLMDLQSQSPQDSDLPLLAARFALEAGAFSKAKALADQALADRPHDLYARLLRASALVAEVGPAFGRDLAILETRLPGSPVIAALRAEAERPSADFTHQTAAWRQHAPADATIREGADIARSDLATVVIGFRNQPGLLAAVQSLLAQDQATEIVVVNTGGGDVAETLAPVLNKIRLIDCATPCKVGAARNTGVAASRAPFLAFLAGDCLARPGWVSGRLAHHRAGELSVSSAVVAEDDAGLVALAANRMRYSSRNPLSDLRRISHYGQSYARALLSLCGPFPPGLAMAEDTALNRLARQFAAPVWAPGVVTTHRDQATLHALLQDEYRRGLMRAAHAPARSLTQDPERGAALARTFRYRLAEADALLTHEPGMSRRKRSTLLATGWVAGMANLRGMLDGLAGIAAADALARQAEALADGPPGQRDQALAFAEAAWLADPADPAKSCLAGSLRHANGDVQGAVVAWRAALTLSPGMHMAAQKLTEAVASAEGAAAALAQAERLALAAPRVRHLWDLAADQALAAGQPAWAVALGQIGLGCAVAAPAAHTGLARLHAKAGNAMAAAFRAQTARRLLAYRQQGGANDGG